MSRLCAVTLCAAAVAGIAAALLLFPRWRDARDLNALASADHGARQRAWERLAPPDRAGEAPSPRRIAEINERLRDAPDEALLDAGAALRPSGLWSWDLQPVELLLREARLRSTSEEPVQQMLAAELMENVPLDLTAEQLLPVFQALLDSADARVRADSLEAAIAWAGPSRAQSLTSLAIPPGCDRLLALRRLAVELAAFLRNADDRVDPPRADPDDDAIASVAAAARADPAVGGEADGHLHDPSSSLLEAIAGADPAGSDGSVYEAVLLAERHLARAEAKGLAEEWIRSFDDDRKRAGALLAALAGGDRSLLREAYEIENVGEVRTIQRLALWAMGRPVGDEDPVEFAYRALHEESGDFDPDTALAMLIAGRPEAIKLLVREPPGSGDNLSEALQKRLWLIERFLPDWRAIPASAPDDGVDSVGAWFDRLGVIWMLSRRRLQFDHERREFNVLVE